MNKFFLLTIWLSCFFILTSLAQCPTLSANIDNVTCFGANNGSINLSVSGDSASLNNPGLIISEFHTDPSLNDSPFEWLELIVTASIDFNITPYTIIFSNNGISTSKGWVQGGKPTPPPANSSFAFLIDSGLVSPGDVVYVGGSLMTPIGNKLRLINTASDSGDGGIGEAFLTSGVLGNGGGVADGIAVFRNHVSQIDSSTVPVDAVFFGTGIGAAALVDTSIGFTLPNSDLYSGGHLKSTSYCAPEIITKYSLVAHGIYNRSSNNFTVGRTFVANTIPWNAATSSISIQGNSYLWSNGSTTKSISSLAAGTYTVTVTSADGCNVQSSFNLTEPAPLMLTLLSVDTICFGTSDGNIISSLSGGEAPYSYLWSNNSVSSNLGNIFAGTYTLTVTDINGCISTQYIDVNQTTAIYIDSVFPIATNASYPIIIKGSNLSSVTQVNFGLSPADSFTLLGDTAIVAVVPINADNGPITLYNNSGCSVISSFNFNLLNNFSSLTLKVYLDGLYAGGGYMNLPLVNGGFAGDGLSVDTVEALLYLESDLTTPVVRRKAVLKSNGLVEFIFPGHCIGNQYWLVIKNRNSIETWSKNPILFSENTYYNFSGIYHFPTVSTLAVSGITGTTSISGGIVNIDGGSNILSKGVCWSTFSNPTVALVTKTINGSGTGSFTSFVNNLNPGTTYFIRAYATNIVGTAYGNEISFSTLSGVTDLDGNIYDTIVIGSQVWLKKNLKVTKYRNGDSIPTILNNNAQWPLITFGALTLYNNSYLFDSLAGKLYNWYAVSDPRGLCPTNWHIPSDEEWNTLVQYLDSNACLTCTSSQSTFAGGALKEIGNAWPPPNAGATNSTGFSAIPGGYRSWYGTDMGWGDAYLWSSSQFSITGAYCRFLFSTKGDIERTYTDKREGYSVRCMKNSLPKISTSVITNLTTSTAISGGNVIDDSGSPVISRGVCWSTSSNPTDTLVTKTVNGTGTGNFISNLTGLSSGTTYYIRAYAKNNFGTAYGVERIFTTLSVGQNIDIDGNMYDTVVIGTQTWFKRNLSVTRYRNGDSINTGLTNSQWQTTVNGAYSIYNNDTLNEPALGRLYNWYSVVDSRGLCPSGWHVPSDFDWNRLILYLDPTTCVTCLGLQSWIAGSELKDTSTTGGIGFWNSPNQGATNSTGFKAIAGGYRAGSGVYYNLNQFASMWSSTEISPLFSWRRDLYYNDGRVNRDNGGKNEGCSVRCLKDGLPELLTDSILFITSSTATTGGIITYDGGAPVITRGVCWSTSPNPTVALVTKTVDGSGDGSFISLISNLSPGITYYVRAYAINPVGISYGVERIFTTMSSGHVFDVDGNIYDTVVIGSQVWMKQNLRTTKYSNGDNVIFNSGVWNTPIGYFNYYGNSLSNDSVYGKLYNGVAVADSRNLCPTGWHVPSNTDWKQLIYHLDVNSDTTCNTCQSSLVAGGYMKNTGIVYWATPNVGATNSSNFTALPGGIYSGNVNINSGLFQNINYTGNWWSSDFGMVQLENSVSNLWVSDFGTSQLPSYSTGYSVRCIKD